MELRVQLKICEGCGCLWYRPQNQCSSYCRECAIKLSDFPVSTRWPYGASRRKRGRPRLMRVCAVAENFGGAE
jgi:hypothetical protein